MLATSGLRKSFSRAEHEYATHPSDDILDSGRAITFSPKVEVFKSVIEQIAKTATKPDFWTSYHHFAVATPLAEGRWHLRRCAYSGSINSIASKSAKSPIHPSSARLATER